MRPLLLLAVAALAASGCSSSSTKASVAAPSTAAATTTSSTLAPVRSSAGCAGPAPVPSDAVPITAGGVAGTYLLHVPPSGGADRPVPLVMDLHGYSETAAIQAKISGLSAFGDTEGFATVTPQATRPVPLWAAAAGSADLTFLGGVLDDVEAKACIDLRRVFVAGLSNGAFMASAVPCGLADRVAAVAPVAGLRDIEDCHPSRPVPVVAFHGTADTFVAYDGGLGASVANLPSPDGKGTLGSTGAATAGPSVEAQAAKVAERNGCQPVPSQETIGADVVHLHFSCPAGDDVELYRIVGGGHTWPGSPVAASLSSLIGRTTTTISANTVMWAFFEAHPLP